MARYRVGLETRERILEATRALLGEVGVEGTTLKAVCDRAAVGAGSFYNLFESKDEAILEVVREAIGAVDPDPAGLGHETVTDLLDAYVRFILGEPTLARIYIQLAVGGGLTDGALARRVLRHHRRRVERFADALHRDGTPADEAQRQAEHLLGCLTGLAVSWLLDPSFPFRAQVERLAANAGIASAVGTGHGGS